MHIVFLSSAVCFFCDVEGQVMLSEGPSGPWWGCRTTQVEASDAQPEQGGPASISPIHSPCVHTHTGVQPLKHPLKCQQTHSHTHAQFACTLGAYIYTHKHTHSRGNSHKVRATLKLFTVLVKKDTLCVLYISGLLSHRGLGVCLSVCMWAGRLLWSFPPTQPLDPQRWLKGRDSRLESGQRAGVLFSQVPPHLSLTFSH